MEFEFSSSKDYGWAASYARFRPGQIHSTYELAEGVHADVDSEGTLLGLELLTMGPTLDPED